MYLISNSSSAELGYCIAQSVIEDSLQIIIILR